MHSSQFLISVLASPFVVVFVSHVCRSLLRSAQGREDADDERLWHYLLDPRSL
jgi:hypothetical protein